MRLTLNFYFVSRIGFLQALALLMSLKAYLGSLDFFPPFKIFALNLILFLHVKQNRIELLQMQEHICTFVILHVQHSKLFDQERYVSLCRVASRMIDVPTHLHLKRRSKCPTLWV